MLLVWYLSGLRREHFSHKQAGKLSQTCEKIQYDENPTHTKQVVSSYIDQ